MNITLEQANEFMKALGNAGFSADDVLKITAAPGNALAKTMYESLAANKPGKRRRGVSTTLVVNYAVPLEQMEQACNEAGIRGSVVRMGNFVLSDAKDEMVFEWSVLPIKEDTSTADVVRMIEGLDSLRPWSPAKIEHLLALYTINPAGILKSPRVVALGSSAVVHGNDSVPIVDTRPKRMDLSLTVRDTKPWSNLFSFLIVRPSI